MRAHLHVLQMYEVQPSKTGIFSHLIGSAVAVLSFANTLMTLAAVVIAGHSFFLNLNLFAQGIYILLFVTI